LCRSCGAPIEAGQKFCSECGAELSPALISFAGLAEEKERRQHRDDCSSCGAVLEPEASFCFECGEAVDKPQNVHKPEPIVPDGVSANAGDPGAGAGFLGALWGSSAGCGCGCFTLILALGFLAVIGALL